MSPLDLRTRPPRSPYTELAGLMFMPRTIDKLRAQLPGGNTGVYFINGKIKGMSGYLLERLGITEAELLETVRTCDDEQAIARWLRERTDPAQYDAINQTMSHLKLKHSGDETYVRELYAETLAAQPDLVTLFEIMEADDRRLFA
ncbi:MAG TPA: DUF5069 domain-containing protein [Candidatus Acidoferrales bacterium]|nr:DUF5069 domain-containing protein [Candidatus Acidoferrales bacterium]